MRKLILILLLIWPFTGEGQVPFMLVEDQREAGIYFIDSTSSHLTGRDVWGDNDNIFLAADEGLIMKNDYPNGLTQTDSLRSNYKVIKSIDNFLFGVSEISGNISLDRVLITDTLEFLFGYGEAGANWTRLDVVKSGWYSVYLADSGNNRITKISFNDPTVMGYDSRLTDPSQYPSITNYNGVAADTNYAWGFSIGKQVYDTSLTRLHLLSQENTTYAAGESDDNVLFHTVGSSITRAVYTPPSSMGTSSKSINSIARDLYLTSSRLFVAAESDIYVFSRSGLTQEYRYQTNSGINTGIWYNDPYIYVSNTENGLIIYELHEP